MQVLNGRTTEIAAACGEVIARVPISAKESEDIEKLKSAASTREAITCVRFRLLVTFGVYPDEVGRRAKKVTKAKKSNSLRFILDKSINV